MDRALDRAPDRRVLRTRDVQAHSLSACCAQGFVSKVLDVEQLSVGTSSSGATGTEPTRLLRGTCSVPVCRRHELSHITAVCIVRSSG